MAGAVVGIDLGTTNTVVAVVRGGKALVLADESGNRLLPSVVSFHPNGEVLIGMKARERRLVDARNTVYSIKRLIGRSWQSEEVERARQRFPFELREGPTHGPLVAARGETYTLPEISAFVLRRAKQIAETALGEPVERAVVTVPASFNDLQRASTKVAAREAGLEVLRILNEPTAAALAYGFGKSGSERIAVYDFGGGTFDLTLLDLSGNVFEVIATAGDSFLGGDDVDYVIADKIAMTIIQQTRFDPRQDVQVMERLRAAAEQVKVALSTQTEMNVELKEVGYGPGGAPIDVKFAMSRGELEALAMPLVDRTFKVCAEALQLARVQVDAFDNVILVGGSTRIPLVRRRVEQFFNKKPMDRVNPDEVVAIGAAIQAAALTGAERRRASTPAPVMQGDAVKSHRIQTLGGVGKNDPLRRALANAPATGSRGANAPPPRTTGRLITSPIGPGEGQTLPKPGVATRTETERADAVAGIKLFRDALDDEETTVNKSVSDLEDEEPTMTRNAVSFEEDTTKQRVLPPPFPTAGPPPLIDTRPPPRAGDYPDIAGALPARPQVTAPLVPLSKEPPLTRGTARNIAVPTADRLGPPLPTGFPDHSPEPMQLRNLSPQTNAQAASPMFPPPQQPPPIEMPPAPPPQQPAPTDRRKATQLGMAPHRAPEQAPSQSPAQPPQRPPLHQTQVQLQPQAPAPLPPAPAERALQPGSVPPLPHLSGGPPSRSALKNMPTPFGASSWPAPAGNEMPLLIDVTPLTLAVETVGGFVDRVIARNTPVPCSQTRTFTTSVDGQRTVLIRVCQGEHEAFTGNTALGQLELSGLRAARRGEVFIEVTFELDADGILQVRARDVETSRETGAQMRLIGIDAQHGTQGAMPAII